MKKRFVDFMGLPKGIGLVAILMLTIALVFGNASHANANGVLLDREWFPVEPVLGAEGTEPSLVVEQQGSIDVEPTVSFTFAGTWIDKLEIDDQQFQQLRVPGCGATGEIGRPEMPFKGIFLEIPYGVEVELEIFDQERVSLGTGYRIYPVQEPMPDLEGAPEPPFAFDAEAYAANRSFPENPIEVEAPAFIREKRVVFVKIFPMSYNPGTSELIGYKNLSFRLVWRGEIDPRGIKEKQRLRSRFFNPLPEELLANYTPETSPEVDAVNDAAASRISTPVDNETEDSAETDLSTTNAADYLIIVYDSLADEILPLANWKNRMGYVTRVVNMSTVGTTYSDVMTYIQNAYNTWNPAPSFVLLVGDHNQVPPHNADVYHPYHKTSTWPTDHTYACTSGSDYFPDLAIGRLSVSAKPTCTTVVNKILEYERTPNSGTWWDDALIAALFQDRDGTHTVKDGTADRWFMETATHILDYLNDTVGYDIDTAQCTDYWPLEYTTFHYRSDTYPHRPTPPDPVPTAVVNRWTSASQSTTDVTTAINGGVGVVLHRDHGGETGWGHPPYSIVNINALTNGDMTPVVFSMNCLTGAFDYLWSDCFAERFQKQFGGGASGVVAATRVSYSGYNDLLARGIFTSFWPGYDSSYTGTTYPNSWRVAEALNFGKYYMYTYEGSGTYTEVEFKLFHWFGDPSMMMRTVNPQMLTVSHDSTISQSATSFTVNVTQDGALVALEQDGNVLGTATSSGGSATVSISSSLSTITVYVTVTNHDYLPYEGTVTVGVGCNPFSENFNDGVADNWSTDGSGTWGVTSEVYRMTGTTPASSTVRYTYYNGDSADFTYQARVRKTSGSTTSSMGLYFRSSDGSENNNAYIFHINANGSYNCYKYVGGVFTSLAGDWIAHAAINAGLNVWNTLKVVAYGNSIKIYCNGTLLDSYTDSSHSAGKPGLKAYDTSFASDVVEFDDVKLSCGGSNMGAIYLLLLGD